MNLKSVKLFAVGFFLTSVLAIAQNLNPSPVQQESWVGAILVSANADAEGRYLTITAENISGKDIAAFQVSTVLSIQNFLDGGPVWRWDQAAEQFHADWRISHYLPVPAGPPTHLLHPGEFLEGTLTLGFASLPPFSPVWARVDVVAYTDGSAEVRAGADLQKLFSDRRDLASTWGPVVDYEPEARELASPEPFNNRQVRDKFFAQNGLALVEKPPIPGIQEIMIPGPSDLKWLPALPIQQSDLVVLGRIVQRKAFLTSELSRIYSEIYVQIESVLRDPDQSTPAGTTIVLQRPGGIVRFNDGSIQIYRIAQQDWPLLHSSYILFLKKNQTGDFDLLTGYQMRGIRTYALDGAGDDNSPFRCYSGMQQKDFLNTLTKRIAEVDSTVRGKPTRK